MKTILIDGTDITTIEEVHDIFSDALDFPSYYGRNLDALHDCLTDVAEPVWICVDNVSALTEKLGKPGEALLLLLESADEENPNISCLFAAD